MSRMAELQQLKQENEDLEEEKEDVELELEIVERQVERYMGTEFAPPPPGVPMSVEEAPREMPLNGRTQMENDIIAERNKQIMMQYEKNNMERQLAAAKERLAHSQRRECEKLHQRRQAALEEHRRNYERLHPGAAAAAASAANDDSDSDYDTLDNYSSNPIECR